MPEFCPDCGASNRSGETVCFLCGRSLGTALPETSSGVPTPATAPSTAAFVNPYEGPRTVFSPSRALWLAAELLIVAIVVCLGVVYENNALGAFLAVVFALPLAYTFIVSVSREAKGRPMADFEKVGAFTAALAAVVVGGFSAVIAFFVSCFSSLAVTDRLGKTFDADINMRSGYAIGPAIATAVFTTCFLLYWNLRSARRSRKP
jgi:hypothetical protein